MLDSSLRPDPMTEVDRRFRRSNQSASPTSSRAFRRRVFAKRRRRMMARLFKGDGLGIDRWQIKIDDLKHLPGYRRIRRTTMITWNVVGAAASPKGRSLILNGHIDVVPEDRTRVASAVRPGRAVTAGCTAAARAT